MKYFKHLLIKKKKKNTTSIRITILQGYKYIMCILFACFHDYTVNIIFNLIIASIV